MNSYMFQDTHAMLPDPFDEAKDDLGWDMLGMKPRDSYSQI